MHVGIFKDRKANLCNVIYIRWNKKKKTYKNIKTKIIHLLYKKKLMDILNKSREGHKNI